MVYGWCMGASRVIYMFTGRVEIYITGGEVGRWCGDGMKGNLAGLFIGFDVNMPRFALE